MFGFSPCYRTLMARSDEEAAMLERHWQLDGNAPEPYQRYLVPAITSKWATDLVDRAKPKPGEAVLDVACGRGLLRT